MECCPIPSVQPALDDLIAEAQHILTLLSPDSHKALSACNRRLRTLVHSTTKSVTVNCHSDLSRLAKGDWSHLALATMRQCYVVYSLWEQQDALDIMRPSAALIFSKPQYQAIVFVRPFQGQGRSDCQPHSSLGASSSSSQLDHVTWTKLEMTNALEPIGMKYILAMRLVHVRLLDLRSHVLDAAVVVTLVNHLPQLEWLRLTKCDISDYSARQLVQGGIMSKIKNLDLGFSSCATFAIIDLLCTTAWLLLEKLNLDGVNFAGMPLEDLKHIVLPSLQEISLNDCGLTPSASVMTKLSQLPWLHLHNITLSGNKLGESAVANLARVSLPCLSKLDLAWNVLNDGAARHLVKGDWPLLDQLWLHDNYFGPAAMIAIAKGDWPRLEYLLVHGNSIGFEGVQSLTQGRWPVLRDLSLDLNILHAHPALYDTLSLPVVCIHGLGPCSACWYSPVDEVRRKLPRDLVDNDFLWPCLKSVLFRSVK